MAIRTLSLSHRDLNQTELNTLEALIDAAGIEAVLQGLSEICGLKADHIRGRRSGAELDEGRDLGLISGPNGRQ